MNQTQGSSFSYLHKVSEVSITHPAVVIQGLPGMGLIGKIATNFLIEHYEAIEIARIYSSFFPPVVQIDNEQGVGKLARMEIYAITQTNPNLLILTGDAQPVSAQAEYALSDEILNICKKLKIDEIYTLAAYITGKFSKTPKVFGTSTSLEVVKEFSNYDVIKMNRGSITGMNGVIIGTAKKSSIRATCLLGETSGYVIDAKASKAVLEVLSKMLKIEIDMSELNKKAADTEQVIKSIESQAASQLSATQPIGMPTKDEKSLDYIS